MGQGLDDSTLDLLLILLTMDLLRARQNGLAVRMDDAHVAPSGRSKLASPAFQRAIEVDAIVCVEGAGEEVLLDDLHDGGVGEDLTRVLASLSAFPLDKVREDGLACATRLLHG